MFEPATDVTNNKKAFFEFNEKDKRFQEIQRLIAEKERMLFEKRAGIEAAASENDLLKDVKQDYDEYYAYIRKQKQDQIDALMQLEQYIVELNREGKLSRRNLKDAKREQHNILREVNDIRRSINGLIQGLSSQDPDTHFRDDLEYNGEALDDTDTISDTSSDSSTTTTTSSTPTPPTNESLEFYSGPDRPPPSPTHTPPPSPTHTPPPMPLRSSEELTPLPEAEEPKPWYKFWGGQPLIDE